MQPSANIQIHEIPVIVLAGGFGTRLRALDAERPKPMVPVLERPFMYWLIQKFYTEGFRRFILSTGYKAELIECYPWGESFPEASFSVYRESEPLGTGGAVKAIYSEYPTLDLAWVVNGDTFIPAALPSLAEISNVVQGTLDAIYAVQQVAEVFDATPNLVTDERYVLAESDRGNLFDAGSVLVTRNGVENSAEGVPCKLNDLLREAMGNHRVGYSILPGTCYDIGTPERFKRFEAFLRTNGYPQSFS